MLTVSLVLVFTAISGDVLGRIEYVTDSQLTLNILFGLGFFIPGIIGGLLNENEPWKAIITIVLSFLVIGAITALSLSVFCTDLGCIWVVLTIQGIPTAMVETTLGFLLGDWLPLFETEENTITETVTEAPQD
ncbi:MAG: hypothetical protein ACXAE3_17685 [Candidatus Kariarchaeaceae archaeon]|jgi:hypothetical protein